MAGEGNNGVFKAGYSGSAYGGHNRFQGRGRSESYGGGRSVRARSSRDDYRYWLNARDKPPKDHERFVLVSYNILADVNAWTHYNELYWHIQRYILDWDERKKKILRELGLWSPDIICLQEVDHYEDLNGELEKEGYVGMYTSRTGATRDGCAMFWRKNRFELLEGEDIKFKDHNLKDNVAQLCVLQTKSKTLGRNDTEDSEATNGTEPTTSGSSGSKNNRVVVGNIHVLFNPKRGDVKLGQFCGCLLRHLLIDTCICQARILMEKAHALSEKWGKVPVAIAGDFNSTPGSALYQFISSSQLDLADHDRRNISGQEEEGLNGGFKRERNGTNSGSSYDAEAGAEEVSALNAESSVVLERTIDSSESTVATIGEEDLATHIVHQKITRLTVERVSIPKRVRGWDPFELMAATGERHLSVVQHKMNLRSAYSEIEGKPGSRDERGEPLITTFHKKFGGTVDYIWHTDDLVTVRVLDILPISVLQDYRGRPKIVLKDCEGLPTKKWGSDHLALACEFSFVPSKDTSSRKAEQESA
ncbi:hypothetical protein M758_6G192700 [Ceratodon purpureus]|nr:hypothetical protein M758_6G192700 [Ceratodon purpureus]